MSKMNPVVHFEMPAEDKERMKNFYTKVFGWQMKQYGPEMGDYVVATTSEVGEDHFPKQRGTINGGFYQKSKDNSPHPSVVISVDDINESIEKVKKAGGKVFGEPVEIPGIGKYVSFTDTEGNRISMLQPSSQM
ncbi:MAG TPA: VOC family protein [Ignavibacteriaceae bacterium]|nr:VOC family protein [Ignavibacteriaceae bacterium]